MDVWQRQEAPRASTKGSIERRRGKATERQAKGYKERKEGRVKSTQANCPAAKQRNIKSEA